jgi:hypothetical protein
VVVVVTVLSLSRRRLRDNEDEDEDEDDEDEDEDEDEYEDEDEDDKEDDKEDEDEEGEKNDIRVGCFVATVVATAFSIFSREVGDVFFFLMSYVRKKTNKIILHSENGTTFTPPYGNFLGFFFH